MSIVDRDVLAVLSDCSVAGDLVYLPGGQLDRKLYLRVNAVLEALGGKWDRKARAHVFGGDPSGTLDDCILTGSYERPEDFGFFPTPPDVAARVAELADLREGQLVLEPSAGTGALVDACLARVPTLEIMCVELQPDLVAKLRAKFSKFVAAEQLAVLQGDFLAQRARVLGLPAEYDRVVMNPPFARGQDVDHVTHALEFLRPGGRLVSVMSAGVEFRQDKRYADFRRLEPTIERLPEKSFRPSGTDVRAVIVVLEKKS